MDVSKLNEIPAPTMAQPAAPRRMTMAKVTKGPVLQAPRVLLYGAEGIGKSTFASGAPAPIWLGELGTQHLDVSRFPAIERWQDVLDAIHTLTEENHDRKTLVIDGLAEIEGHIWQHLCAANKWANIEHLDYGKGYIAAVDEWRRLVFALERLHQKKDMGIVLIGHSVVKQTRPPEGEAYDKHVLTIHDKAAGLLRRLVDYVLFAQIPVTTVKGADKRVRGKTDGVRLFHAQPSATFDAKSRPSLPTPLPLSWEAFASARATHDPAHRVARATETMANIKALLAELGDEATARKVLAHTSSLAPGDVERFEEVENALKAKMEQSK